MAKFAPKMAMIAEGLCMGVKAGADPEIMRQVISVSSGNSTLFQMRVADFLIKGEFAPGFMLDLMKKDVGLDVGLGKEMNLAMPIAAVADQLNQHPQQPFLLVDAAQSFGQPKPKASGNQSSKPRTTKV